MILVIGATGQTGQEVVRELVGRGAPVRGVSRSEEGAARIRELGAEGAVADIADPASLEPAFRGVETAYVATPSDERQLALEENVFSVAEAAGAYRVVKLSVLAAAEDAPVRFSRSHARSEAALQASSLRWTILRPSGFMQNYLMQAGAVAGEGRLYSAAPDGAVSHIDARDISAVAAKVLSEEGHDNTAYTLTGPEAHTDHAIAAQLGEVRGRDVELVPISDDQFRASLLANGLPEYTAGGLVELRVLFGAAAPFWR